ncbi:HDIG domain-containing protein [Candidatus Pacearchaeota archaeon]|nr:HDIG domain-containing protein [Candidatus Pacearchaeota archaeon]
MNKEEALQLLNESVKSESLRGHCKAVAAAMKGYAEKFGEDVDKWWVCGLLHDFDWEMHPTLEDHPAKGVEILREKGVDEDICVAILGHNEYCKVPRESKMAKVLFAVDELCGLIVALARVRPGNFEGMSAKSVKKVMKKKDFAAAINRGDILKGIDELGVDSENKKFSDRATLTEQEKVAREDEHFIFVIKSLEKVKGELGF